MNSWPASPVEISEADIALVQRLMKLELGLPEHEFLKSTSSCDVHACPGSGKTTLLVAKLAILSGRWTTADQGILVLSHTNVAREEVEKLLALHPSGSHLLAYPHFIGTIQSFVHRYLALPYLREVGIEDQSIREPRIDDDFYEHYAWNHFKRLGNSRYPQARAFLSNRNDAGRDLVSKLVHSGPTCSVRGRRLPDGQSPSGKQLRALKTTLSKEGVFRYADMFAFAAASLEQHAYLAAAIRRRFPWVFIDEMQDTSAEQEQLLNELFAPSRGFCVVQRLGDANQGIFRDDEGGTRFGHAATISMPQSHRLSPTIAAFASPLTTVQPQRIAGNPQRQDRAHTVFLFNEHTIKDVLPAFAQLVLQEWQDIPNGFVAKAVGFRKTAPAPEKFPGCLNDYWPPFSPELHQHESQPKLTLQAAILHARHLIVAQNEYHAAHHVILEAIARLISLKQQKRTTRQELKERLNRDRVIAQGLNAALTSFLHEQHLEASSWNANTAHLISLLFGRQFSAGPEIREFIAWQDTITTAKREHVSPNIFPFHHLGRRVEIAISTIHAVKGETHDATLVLETYTHQHDLVAVMPCLCSEAALSEPKGRTTEQMKAIFVAMTRPKELLCLALRDKHVTPTQREQLGAAGWNIKHLLPA